MLVIYRQAAALGVNFRGTERVREKALIITSGWVSKPWRAIFCGVALYGTVAYGTVGSGAVRCGPLRYGTVRCGVVQFWITHVMQCGPGVTYYAARDDTVRYDTILPSAMGKNCAV